MAEAYPPAPPWVDDFLNRRFQVERALRYMAAGKVALPDAEECRRLANLLSVPSEFGNHGAKHKRSPE